MTPSALALSPDQKRLFVVCSDANAVAVVDISKTRSRVAGFIPTGWYPTAARVLADGRLVVLNGRGSRSYPNPKGPVPLESAAPSHRRRSPTRIRRQHPDRHGVRDRSVHRRSTSTSTPKPCIANSPYRDEQLDARNVAGGSVIHSAPGDPSPIEHVIYIVKENRTYDQVLGDLGKGNGDPSLVAVRRERRAQSPQAGARVRAVRQLLRQRRRQRRRPQLVHRGHRPGLRAEACGPTATAGRRKLLRLRRRRARHRPPAGYIWTNALAAGLTVRNYGEFVDEHASKPDPTAIRSTASRDPALAPDHQPELPRLRSRLSRRRARQGVPRRPARVRSQRAPCRGCMFLRLGNDHTSGPPPGKIAPLSAVADNDYALGMIVEGGLEEPVLAEDGHLRARRRRAERPRSRRFAPLACFVISPYARRGVVDSTMYNTTSMLRTMELILGLRPMTHFDAGARPHDRGLRRYAGPAPYAAEKPRISLDETQSRRIPPPPPAPARMDFAEADRIDDDELNDILWAAIKGTAAPPPGPELLRPLTTHDHSLFSLAHAPAVLQGPGDRRVQTALDAPARAQGLLRHGARSSKSSRSIHQTFNLVPSMMVQIEEYAPGEARPIRSSIAPCCPPRISPKRSRPSSCSTSSRPTSPRMIYRYPRYGELYAWSSATAAEPFFARRTCATCRCSPNWPGSTRISWRAIPRLQGLVAQGPRLLARRSGPDGAQAARDAARA